MKFGIIEIIVLAAILLVYLAVLATAITLVVLVIKALLVYIRTNTKAKAVRKETEDVRKTLAETLKEHRTRCKMTQEFVAETVGVSRQAVSKWETGDSDPSMSNLVLLAKLYGVPLEELLENVI